MGSRRLLLTLGVLAGALAGWLIAGPFAPTRATADSNLPPAKRTGAPGENTCNTCHNGALNDGVGTLSIVGVPSSYVPGQAYSLSVTLSRTGQSRWGFELTCLKTSDNSAAGSSTNTTLLTTTQVSSGKTYISQTTQNVPNDGTFAGVFNGPVTWSFQWTAPAAGAGQVRFYAVGVACDNDGDAGSGDLVYTTSTPSAEGSTTDVEATTWGKIKLIYR